MRRQAEGLPHTVPSGVFLSSLGPEFIFPSARFETFAFRRNCFSISSLPAPPFENGGFREAEKRQEPPAEAGGLFHLQAASAASDFQSLFKPTGFSRWSFSSVRLTKKDLKRVHGVDERISKKEYADIVRFFVRLIQNVAS